MSIVNIIVIVMIIIIVNLIKLFYINTIIIWHNMMILYFDMFLLFNKSPVNVNLEFLLTIVLN